MRIKNEFSFYYDETEHSRKINHTTITQDNYYDSFITVIIGFEDINKVGFEKRYLSFENKYEDRKSNGELKSTTIKNKNFINGFASMNADNLELLEDFFKLFNDEVYVYFSFTSKIEYIINQLFTNYNYNMVYDIDLMKYTIIKALVRYRPQRVLDSIYDDNIDIVDELKVFFKGRINYNNTNLKLKEHENESFQHVLSILDEVENNIITEWDYSIPFDGFRKYLLEKNINNYSLLLDKEGNEKTLNAAKKEGIKNVAEEDSKGSVGIRCSDMLAGIIGKFSKSIEKMLGYESLEDGINRKLLPKKWFVLDERQFILYKTFKVIISELNNAWYKSIVGIYADDLIALTTLINYISNFDTLEKFNEISPELHSEQFNTFSIIKLNEHYTKVFNKLPIEYVQEVKGEDYMLGSRGQKLYADDNKYPALVLKEGENFFEALNVGYTGNGNPMITVKENNVAVCYLLPNDLLEWALTCVGFSAMGMNFFPSKVMFTKCDGKVFADVL